MSASKSKLASLIASALTVLLVASGADAGGGGQVVRAPHLRIVPRHLTVTNASMKVSDDANVHGDAKALPVPGPRQVYIVQLEDSPVATYRGGVPGYSRTMMTRQHGRAVNATARGLLDTKSPASRAYAGYLKQKQTEFKQRLEQRIHRSVNVLYSYKFTTNGVAAKLTTSEAAQAKHIAGVKSVRKDRRDPLDTSDTPEFLGLPGVWDGTGTGLDGAMGEGLIVGVLDTGINQANHSFAAVGDDGYAPVNPYGDGVFLGECNSFPGLCNNKLIGSYYFLDSNGGTDPLTPPGDPISKDTDGHGSHTSSTAAGNMNDQATVYNFLGDDSGFSFGRVSGMAPHANVIMYKICTTTEPEPSRVGCSESDQLMAIDQAIQDGVNVINHSISTGGGSPWDEDIGDAFLGMRAAGVIVSHSAGNTGPNPGTAATGGNAPWVTSVAASTHWREIPDKLLHDLSGGDTPPPGPMSGKALTPGVSGSIVYAGDFDNGDVAPQQCDFAFPAGTWTHGEIVVCDRAPSPGTARVVRCANAAAGGAGGCILANVDGGSTNIVADPHVIPAIQIDNVDGNALKAWLASGSGHQGVIDPTPDPIHNPDVADIMADFSSRGPYTGFEFLAPSVSAPGVDVLASGANLQFHHPGFDDADTANDPAVAGDYGIISGTSMSSPHVAGSSALMRQLHPDWTPAEILSALMTTGTTAMRKEDGATPADPFDFGGGRIQPADAARVGLVLDETVENFAAANPALGGDPSTLNVASMVSNACAPTCSWERTVRNATEGTVSYHVSTAGESGMTIEVNPASFSLEAGETQTLSITADVTQAAGGVFNFGEVQLIPDTLQGTLTAPTQHLPVAAFFSTSSDPTALAKTVDKSDAAPGTTLTYQIEVTNTGAEDVFDVSDVVPASATFVPGSETEIVTGGTTLSPWQESGGTLTWSGRLDPTTNALVPADFGGFLSLGSIGVPPLGCPSNCDDGGFIIGGFNLRYQGQDYDTVIMSVNGVLEGGEESGLVVGAGNVRLPDPAAPNNLLVPFWTDMNLGDGGNWYAAILTDGVSNYDVFSWESVPRFDDPTIYSFQIWAIEGQDVVWFSYGEVPAIPADNLTVGFEDAAGLLGTSYYYNGEGTAPEVGTDLQVTATAGGKATLGFQAIASGDIGDTILNIAESTNSSGTENALAVTTIANDTDGDGVGDDRDNCTLVANASQCDSDTDNYGNACDGDFDNSGFVNYGDLAALKQGFFGPSEPPDYSELDMDCDGAINMTDLGAFKQGFGLPPGPSGLAGN